MMPTRKGWRDCKICHLFPIPFCKQYIYCSFLWIEVVGGHIIDHFLWKPSMYDTRMSFFDNSNVENKGLTFMNYGKKYIC